MVAPEHDERVSITVELAQEIEDSFAVRPSVNVVTEEEELIVACGSQEVQQSFQSSDTAVYISDDEEPLGHRQRLVAAV